MDSPRDSDFLLRETTEICGAAAPTTTEAVPSKTKSVQFICESVVCVLKVYVPAIKGVP
jgi:hypothetical protein